MTTCYDFIYKLRPLYEDLKNGGTDWYKLQWRPIKGGTWNLYIENTNRWGSNFYLHLLGIRFYPSFARNGWGRWWRGFAVEIGLIWCIIHFWIRWDIKCMSTGPQDVAEEDKRPLDLSQLKK